MKILMVCLGNICRSPLAQGILEHKVSQRKLGWEIDSAGTSAYHIGNPPDLRSIKIASDHNIDISSQQARQIISKDLEVYDHILVMDSTNYQNVKALISDESQAGKINHILNYVYPEQNRAVPDPYYDGSFAEVYELLDAATDAFILSHA